MSLVSLHAEKGEIHDHLAAARDSVLLREEGMRLECGKLPEATCSLARLLQLSRPDTLTAGRQLA